MSQTSSKTRILVEGAAMVALATVLSFIRIFKLPWGGSITLLSMLPIVVFSIRRGVKAGLAASFVFSLIQFVQGIMDGLFGWGLTPGMLVACILLDYILAFTVLGIAGLFRNMEFKGCISGVALALVSRYVLHVISGYVIWQSYGELWSDFFIENSLLYSLVYNGCYMLPELVFTMIATCILFAQPQAKKAILNLA